MEDSVKKYSPENFFKELEGGRKEREPELYTNKKNPLYNYKEKDEYDWESGGYIYKRDGKMHELARHLVSKYPKLTTLNSKYNLKNMIIHKEKTG